MTEIDYSKNDFIDINNQLFRRARNNISKTVQSIDDLDSDSKAQGEKNLETYGSELINNLKQINYTYEQIESYIFIPLKEKIPRTPRKKTKGGPLLPPPPPPMPKKKKTLSTNEEITPQYQDYTFINEKVKDLSYSQLEQQYTYITSEINRIEDILKTALKYDGELTNEYINSIFDESPQDIKDIISYYEALIGERNNINKQGQIKGQLGVPETKEDNIYIDEYKNYSFVNNLSDYSIDELKNKYDEVINEQLSINKLLNDELNNIGLLIPPNGITYQFLLDNKAILSSELIDLISYSEDLKSEEKRIENKIVQDEGKEDENTLPTENVEQTGFPALSDEQITKFKTNLSKPSKEYNLDKARRHLAKVGFPASFYTGKTKKELKQEFEKIYSSTGSGRYKKKGGARKKIAKTPAPAQALPATTATTATAIPATAVPATIDDIEEALELGPFDKEDLTIDIEDNLKEAEKLDETLTNVVNTGYKNITPSYMNKVYELITNLVQFIGRTTVLFITRIKKNLKYLDEDQYDLIKNEIVKFGRNIQLLKDLKYSNIIKDTVFTQLEKETIGLYNEINDSIRNYSKLKNYTSLDALKGGYFIESSSPFIMHSTTKRFL